jgi:hypothetical protein
MGERLTKLTKVGGLALLLLVLGAACAPALNTPPPPTPTAGQVEDAVADMNLACTNSHQFERDYQSLKDEERTSDKILRVIALNQICVENTVNALTVFCQGPTANGCYVKDGLVYGDKPSINLRTTRNNFEFTLLGNRNDHCPANTEEFVVKGLVSNSSIRVVQPTKDYVPVISLCFEKK